jgi:hypothetical protein
MTACFFPLFLQCFYTLPNLEDYAESVIPEVWWHVKFLYLTYDGRYFVSFLFAAFNPLKYQSFLGYQLIPIFLFLSLYASIGMFIKAIFKSLRALDVIALSGLIFVFYIVLNPTLPYSFYYMISSYIYMLPIIMFILFITTLFKIYEAEHSLLKIIYVFTAVFLIMAIAGSNELLLIPMLLTLVLFSFINYKKGENLYELGVLWTALVVSYFIVFSSPGLNDFFQYELGEERSFTFHFNSFIKAISFSNSKIISWISNASFWFLTGVIALFFWLNKEKLTFFDFKFKTIEWFVIILMVILFLHLVVLPYTWAAGSSARDSYNQVFIIPYFFFISFHIFFIFIVTQYLNNILNYRKFKILSFSALTFFLLSLFLLKKENNIVVAYNDLLTGAAKGYYQEMKLNLQKSMNSDSFADSNNVLELCILKNQPKTIFSGVYFSENDEGFHGVYKMYFNLKSIKISQCEN